MGLARINRAQRGLYHGVQKQFGHTTSFSHKRNSRCWNPNVHKKTFYSELMQKKVYCRVTHTALRTIDQMGGLDNYILFTKIQKLDSQWGMKLRSQLIPLWEKKNGKKWTSRSNILWSQRMDALAKAQLDAKLHAEEAKKFKAQSKQQTESTQETKESKEEKYEKTNDEGDDIPSTADQATKDNEEKKTKKPSLDDLD